MEEPTRNCTQAVYAYIKGATKPPGTVRIVQDTGCKVKSVQSALTRMQHEGLIRRQGDAKHSVWLAVSKRRCLMERRGTSPGSRRALKVYGGYSPTTMHPNSLRNLGHNGKDDRWHPKPKAQTALEQAWGWSAFQGVDTINNENENENSLSSQSV